MSHIFTCPGCGLSSRFPDESAGHRVRCDGCGSVAYLLPKAEERLPPARFAPPPRQPPPQPPDAHTSTDPDPDEDYRDERRRPRRRRSGDPNYRYPPEGWLLTCYIMTGTAAVVAFLPCVWPVAMVLSAFSLIGSLVLVHRYRAPNLLVVCLVISGLVLLGLSAITMKLIKDLQNL